VKVEAVFSEGMGRLLKGKAIGDEFTVTCTARIIGAQEVLIDVTGLTASGDQVLVQGDLEVKLLLSHPKRDEA
jgi:hypothetical protein